MCGIFFSSSKDAITREDAEAWVAHRGTNAPLSAVVDNLLFAHSLLPVQGLEPVVQPITRGGNVLVFAGELWHHNYESDTLALFDILDSAENSWSAMKNAVNSLDGMFAFAFKKGADVYFASDIFGEVPLYFVDTGDDVMCATEIKQLIAAGASLKDCQPALPGVLYRLTPTQFQKGAYHEWSFKNDQTAWGRHDLRDVIEASVKARYDANKHQKSAVLLSGGLDSSIMAYELAKLGLTEAFTVATDENAVDVANAAFVCNLLKLNHTVVIAKELDIDCAIAVTEVSNRSIVEEFTCHLPLSNALRDKAIHIVYTGAGADEIFIGYQHTLRFYGKDNRKDMQRDFITKHHSMDLRATNKAFAMNAIEARSPFLSRAIAEYAGTLDVDTLLIGEKRQMKRVLRVAYEEVLGQIAHNPKLIARETMGVKAIFAKRFGDASPTIYREKLKSTFSEKDILSWLLKKARKLN